MSHTQEVKAVEKAIMEHYHEGHAKFDYRYYLDILHDDWKFFMYTREGKLDIIDKEKYCSWYDPKKYDANLNWETEILYIDLTGNVGSAKIRLENERVKYIDYFNLMKLEDKWWIVNKVCYPTLKDR